MSGCLWWFEVFSLENMKTVLFSDMSCSISFFSLTVSKIIILLIIFDPCVCCVCVCVCAF